MAAKNNWGLIGHDWAVEMLKNHIRHHQVRHAYLITGPQGVGRRTLALSLAQALNCPNPKGDAEPCGECQTCTRLQALTYPDLHVVQAELVGGVLKVDQVRELQHSLALAPYEGRYRFALLLRFEEAHTSASNALLKTLEEPNPQVILTLTAENAEQLLPTIVSRCEVLRLRPVPLDTLELALKDRLDIDQEQARFLAHVSNGRPGIAIQYHQHPDILEKRAEILDDLVHLLSASRVKRFQYADQLSKAKDDARGSARLTLQTWSTFWRDVLLRTSQTTLPVTNLDLETKVENLAAQIDVSTAYRLLQDIEKTLGLIDQNVNLRMALEVMLLDMPTLTRAV